MDTPSAFVQKLRYGSNLTGEDERQLAPFSERQRAFNARVDIVQDGDDRDRIVLVCAGWVCLYKVLANGLRQIVSLILPGDLCQPFGIVPRQMAFALGTLSPSAVTFIRPSELRETSRQSPRIEHALWWESLFRTELLNEQIVSLGRRSASERLAHLMCELQVRLSLVDACSQDEFLLPMTQTELGDLLGLSAVHVNRSIRELRELDLLSVSGRVVRLLRLPELAEFAQFDPGYMHLRRSQTQLVPS